MSRATLHLLSFSPHTQGYSITRGPLSQPLEITASSHAWQEWLNTISSFAFEDRAGRHCTIRKERLQRGDAYWYAYRSIQGHTKKRYLGRSADLSLERLEEISTLLTTEEKEAPRPLPQRRSQQLAPLLETKLHPPQLPGGLVERAHLCAQLGSSLTHKLTLLLAPAGFGKTTLLNQWLTAHSTQAIRPATAWISLDPGDNDPLRFWRYVLTASQQLLGQVQKAAGQAALALLTATTHPLFDAPLLDMALTHLLNALADPSSGGLLILDDYHAISEPRIHKTLAFFIDHLPTSVHMLLLTRTEPELPLLRWRAKGELYELHRADLRFSSDESATFLRRTLPIALSEAALTRLDTSLEGWAAGLRLLSLTLAGWHSSQAIEQALLSLDERANNSSPQRLLLDYFVHEILETQPEPMQRFLLYTSILNRLCGPLCNAMIGSENSVVQLEAVERAGLFLERLEGPGAWYRYHALFAEAMRREASRRLGEERLQALSLRASLWYEQEALLTEAIEISSQAHDRERVARLIEQANEQDFTEPQTMLRWLGQFPEAILREHPMLCHLLAVEIRFPAQYRLSTIQATELAPLSAIEHTRIERLLQMAQEGWQRQGTSAYLGANRAFRALEALLNREPFATIVDYARQGLAFLPREDTRDSRLQMYRSTCLLFVGTDELHMGRISVAHEHFIQAQKDNVPPGNRYLAVEIVTMLGKGHLLQGELRRAQRIYVQALNDARELGDDETAIDILLDLAWLAFERNDLTATEQQVHEALALTQHIQPSQQDFYDRATLQLALLQYAQGEASSALQQLMATDSQRTWTRHSFWLSCQLHTWRGRLRIVAGDIHATPDNWSMPSQRGENTSLTEQLAEQILHTRLLLAQGKAKDALQQLAQLLPIAQEHLHQYAALEIQLLLALAYSTCQQEQQAHYWLRQTLLQAVHEGYIRLFLNEGKPLTLLLLSSLKNLQHDGAIYSYAQMLLRTATQSIAHASHPNELEPLSLQERRVLRLLATGRSNRDIAHELVISVNTVKYHVKHLYQKLGVGNRLQASEAARHLNLGEQR